MKPYVVVDADGVLIAKVTWEERNRLLGRTEENSAPRFAYDGAPVFNQPLIRMHRKRRFLCICLVDASVVRSELRRDLAERVPVAEDNTTHRIEIFTNERGAGWYYEHHDRRASGYATTAASIRERNARRLLRERRAREAVAAPVVERSTYFPLLAEAQA